MTKNVGSIDRALRVLLGVVLLSLVFVLDTPARWWGLVGVVPLLTGLFSLCPLYSLLGISSCPINTASR